MVVASQVRVEHPYRVRRVRAEGIADRGVPHMGAAIGPEPAVLVAPGEVGIVEFCGSEVRAAGERAGQVCSALGAVIGFELSEDIELFSHGGFLSVVPGQFPLATLQFYTLIRGCSNIEYMLFA